MELNYIITETGGPDSFDPLKADKTSNLAVMRMLYSTPIEISKDNVLISNVLDKFDYNKDNKMITFILKPNVYYADGTLLTARDVSLSIARMAYFRPSFPVIKDIVGLAEWSTKKQGLQNNPEGIKVDGNKITIELSRGHLNPLFRFCLELFSIIPEKCINLKSGEMNCARAPGSGYFTINSENNDQIVFDQRTNIISVADIVPYKKITFVYKNLKDVCVEKISDNTIISGNEISFIKHECAKSVESKQLHWTPAARFSSVVFNPNVKPFDNDSNRQYFSDKIRDYVKNKHPELIVERSLFSALLPGFISYNNFESIKDNLDKNFAGQKITIVRSTNSSNIARDAIEQVATNLSMDISYLDNPSNEYLDNAFSSGELQVDTSNSGFWAQDPVGDLSMFFTPNLHQTLKYIWKDSQYYKYLQEIENSDSDRLLREKMELFNSYLYSKSLYSPILHFRRIFITSTSIKSLNLPQSITSPAPWQLVMVR